MKAYFQAITSMGGKARAAKYPPAAIERLGQARRWPRAIDEQQTVDLVDSLKRGLSQKECAERLECVVRFNAVSYFLVKAKINWTIRKGQSQRTELLCHERWPWYISLSPSYRWQYPLMRTMLAAQSFFPACDRLLP